MVYSYTQIRQYLTCPRRYRLSLPRQLAGEGHPSCHALRTCIRAGAWRQEDPVGVRFREWSACQNLGLYYSNGDAWERMLQQDIMLLDRFCQDACIRIHQPRRRLQIKFTRPIGPRAQGRSGSWSV